jgi:uncharacterized protein YbjQ (UPF0145 family)
VPIGLFIAKPPGFVDKLLDMIRSKPTTRCLVILLVTGCAHNFRIEDLSSAQRAKLNEIEVSRGTFKNRPYNVVSTISGLSCNRNKYQAQDVTNEEALQGLRIEAVRIGADAVINTFCQKNSDTDWRNNCFASIKCIGDAVIFKRRRTN